LGGRNDEFAAYGDLLNQNGTDLGAMIGAAYGSDSQSKFNQVWSAHNGFFVDYTTGETVLDSGGGHVHIGRNVGSGVLMLSATMSTTAETGTRRPRMQGTPPIWSGLTVIRVNVIEIRLPVGFGRCPDSPSSSLRTTSQAWRSSTGTCGSGVRAAETAALSPGSRKLDEVDATAMRRQVTRAAVIPSPPSGRRERERFRGDALLTPGRARRHTAALCRHRRRVICGRAGDPFRGNGIASRHRRA